MKIRTSKHRKWIIGVVAVVFQLIVLPAIAQPMSGSADSTGYDILDSINLDIHVMVRRNAQTFQQFRDVDTSETYIFKSPKGIERIRIFTLVYRPDRIPSHLRPEALFVTLKYYDKDGKKLNQETMRLRPNLQTEQIWIGKGQNRSIVMSNAAYAELSVRYKVKGQRYLKDMVYHFKLEE